MYTKLKNTIGKWPTIGLGAAVFFVVLYGVLFMIFNYPTRGIRPVCPVGSDIHTLIKGQCYRKERPRSQSGNITREDYDKYFMSGYYYQDFVKYGGKKEDLLEIVEKRLKNTEKELQEEIAKQNQEQADIFRDELIFYTRLKQFLEEDIKE